MFLITKLLLACVVCITQIQCQTYQIPVPTLELLQPNGLRVSIPDDDGVKVFEFHGRINAPISLYQQGDINMQTYRPVGGRWVIEDTAVIIKPGDIINCWVYVQKGNIGYRKSDLQFTVPPLAQSDVPNQKLSQLQTEGVQKMVDNLQTTLSTEMDKRFGHIQDQLDTIRTVVEHMLRSQPKATTKMLMKITAQDVQRPFINSVIAELGKTYHDNVTSSLEYESWDCRGVHFKTATHFNKQLILADMYEQNSTRFADGNDLKECTSAYPVIPPSIQL